tara:strand:+ start:727 stop:1485 length:759 start_codon:yes stop_codon:yes gene_type:complete
MTFSNKEKIHYLTSVQEFTFLRLLTECEKNSDYFSPETYQEIIFNNFNEYINYFSSQQKPLINTIIESYIQISNPKNYIKLFLDWILGHKKLDINAQDRFGNSPLHLISFSRFGQGHSSCNLKIDKLEQRLIQLGADQNISNLGGFTPLQIEEMIVKKITVKKKIRSLEDLKEDLIEKRVNYLKKRVQSVKKMEDLNQIISDCYLLIKKNNRIMLATKVTKEIKKKIIRMAINEPEDYFDYDCYQRSLVKKI